MVSSRFLLCVAVTVVCGAPPKEKKKLRNVIITSFGEMPYEPAEGFYQSDVFPVGIDGVLKEQTMDVALRTGILVEDPNEKKEAEEESLGEEDSSAEDDVTSTNLKRQVSGVSDGEEEESVDGPPLRRSEKRNPKGYRDEEIVMGTRHFGYEFGQIRKPSSKNHRKPIGDSPRDIGEGWNLQDAETILQGRNYNVLVQTPGSNSYPTPHPRELPPPVYNTGGHPVFYPFPQFEHGFPPQQFRSQTGPPKYNSRVDNYERPTIREQAAGKRQFRHVREEIPSKFYSESSQFNPSTVRFSSPQTVYYSDLRGI